MPTRHYAPNGVIAGGFILSPDGNKIAWTGQSWLRQTLFVRNRVSGSVRTYRARGSVRWTADSRRLLYVSDASGTENPHVYAIDTESSSDARDLTPYPGVKASIQQVSDADPTHVLVTHNRRTPRLFDLYRIDLQTGKETLVSRNPGDAVGPVTRNDGAMLGWQRSREAARAPAERQQPRAQRQAQIDRRDDVSIRILGPGPGPGLVWALSNRGRDRMALVTLNPGPGWEHVEFEDRVADIGGAYISSITREPLLISAKPGYPRIELPDPAFRADLAPILARFANGPYGLEINSADRAEKRFILTFFTSTRHEVWLLDRETRQVEMLSGGPSDALAATLAPLQAVEFPSRDGLSLHAFLTLPRGVAPRALPMVLLVHGGPWEQTPWADPLRAEDSARVQFLANRGYAVLQVDFRGSTGYGRAFNRAGMGEFAGRMQDDLLDAIEWARARGIADPAKIAIMGLSYGGYAALTGLAATPQTFACGISIGGPTDLATLIESFPPYWKVDLSMWHDFVGDPAVPADRAEMTRRSPLTHAARIERPVLIIHGGRDVRVRVDQSQRMADALARAGKPVRMLTIAEMGHNPSWWAHRYQVLRETETFLKQCLGGRATGFDWYDPLVWAWTKLSG